MKPFALVFIMTGTLLIVPSAKDLLRARSARFAKPLPPHSLAVQPAGASLAATVSNVTCSCLTEP